MKAYPSILAALACSALFAPPVHAQGIASEPTEGPWMVRLRLLSMSNGNQSAPFNAAGVSFPANAVHLSDKVFPEADVSYFFGRQWSTELILTYPQDHAVSVAGLGNIGTVRHLPPALTLQYHIPVPKSRFHPYIGAGVNFTWITGAHLSAAGIPLDVSRTSFGFVSQIGVDYSLGKHLYLNFDYKHMNLNPDLKVKATGAKLSNVGINPDLISVGVGYRF